MPTAPDRVPAPDAWFRAQAPAKINLGLEVVGKRPDGYHDIRTVFQAVDLCDEIEARTAPGPGIDLRVEGVPAPGGEDNLVVRALQALAERRAPGRGAEVQLRKRIPMGGGLGGGSSDAAAALFLGEAIWGLDPDPHERARLAAALGSDVPFFLTGGTALGEGRGEILTPLPAPPPEWGWVLAISDFFVETSRAFASGDKALTPITQRLRMLQQALGMGDFLGFADLLHNDLEPAALAIQPGLSGIRDWLKDRAPGVGLSGSGATWFAVTPARDAALQLAQEGLAPGVTRPEGLRDLVCCRPVSWGSRLGQDPAS